MLTEYMNQYWEEEDLLNMNFPSKIWPFTDEDLEHIHEVSEGNPRETIKNLRVLWGQQREFLHKFFSNSIEI